MKTTALFFKWDSIFYFSFVISSCYTVPLTLYVDSCGIQIIIYRYAHIVVYTRAAVIITLKHMVHCFDFRVSDQCWNMEWMCIKRETILNISEPQTKYGQPHQCIIVSIVNRGKTQSSLWSRKFEFMQRLIFRYDDKS